RSAWRPRPPSCRRRKPGSPRRRSGRPRRWKGRRRARASPPRSPRATRRAREANRMVNVRVFQLARDLGISSREVIDRLKRLGVDVKTASSSVDEDTADKLKRAVKIDALASRKRRIYGSEEDEAERDQQERELQERIAAEREAREKAAAEARATAEARKAR